MVGNIYFSQEVVSCVLIDAVLVSFTRECDKGLTNSSYLWYCSTYLL